MFICFRCRFDEKENVSGVNNVKSSVQKSVRHKLLEQMPHIETFLDDILPKKEALRIAKWCVTVAAHTPLFMLFKS